MYDEELWKEERSSHGILEMKNLVLLEKMHSTRDDFPKSAKSKSTIDPQSQNKHLDAAQTKGEKVQEINEKQQRGQKRKMKVGNDD